MVILIVIVIIYMTLLYVTDEIYVPWSDVFYLQQNDPGFLYANQILLASPRMFELSMEFAF